MAYVLHIYKRNFYRSKHYLNNASFWDVIPCRLLQIYQFSNDPLVFFFFFYSEYGWWRVSTKPEISTRLDEVTFQKKLSFIANHVSTSQHSRVNSTGFICFRRNFRHPEVSYHSDNYDTSRLHEITANGTDRSYLSPSLLAHHFPQKYDESTYHGAYNL